MASSVARAIEDGRSFSLVYPAGGYASLLSSWQSFMSRPDVHCFSYHSCMFEPCDRRTHYLLITNREQFGSLGRMCTSSGRCSRTGLPHSHEVGNPPGRGRVFSLLASENESCPAGWRVVYVSAIREILRGLPTNRGYRPRVWEGSPASSEASQLSGLIAETLCGLPSDHPLPRLEWALNSANMSDSRQLDLALLAARVPFHVVQDRAFLDPAVREGAGGPASSFLGPTAALGCPWGSHADAARKFDGSTDLARVPSVSDLRSRETEAGRQPRWKGKAQLIPDGLSSTLNHISLARALSHPFHDFGSLPSEVVSSAHWLKQHRATALIRRLQTVHWLETRALELSPERSKRNAEASYTVRSLGCPLHIPLMEELGRMLSIEDASLPALCNVGLPIVGVTLESPFFVPHVEPASLTLEQWLSGAPARRERILLSVLQEGIRNRYLGSARALYAKTA